jgi:hypothetical protein
MSFEDILNRHNDHTVVILPRLHKGKPYAVPGLYCEDCGKLIKWLTPKESKALLKAGVEQIEMIPEERDQLEYRPYPSEAQAKIRSLLEQLRSNKEN